MTREEGLDPRVRWARTPAPWAFRSSCHRASAATPSMATAMAIATCGRTGMTCRQRRQLLQASRLGTGEPGAGRRDGARGCDRSPADASTWRSTKPWPASRQGRYRSKPTCRAHAVLLIPAEQQDGPAYRVGFQNFYVITRYNRSVLYAMAVHDLANAIAARRGAEPAVTAGRNEARRAIGSRDRRALMPASMPRNVVRAALALTLAAALLSGCSPPGATRAHPSIPGLRRRPPADVLSIPDAVPRVEPRSDAWQSAVLRSVRQALLRAGHAEGYVERGVASWYGPGLPRRGTSSGEPYDMYAMTAAHKTLPMPAYARVTNLRNGRRASSCASTTAVRSWPTASSISPTLPRAARHVAGGYRPRRSPRHHATIGCRFGDSAAVARSAPWFQRRHP